MKHLIDFFNQPSIIVNRDLYMQAVNLSFKNLIPIDHDESTKNLSSYIGNPEVVMKAIGLSDKSSEKVPVALTSSEANSDWSRLIGSVASLKNAGITSERHYLITLNADSSESLFVRLNKRLDLTNRNIEEIYKLKYLKDLQNDLLSNICKSGRILIFHLHLAKEVFEVFGYEGETFAGIPLDEFSMVFFQPESILDHSDSNNVRKSIKHLKGDSDQEDFYITLRHSPNRVYHLHVSLLKSPSSNPFSSSEVITGYIHDNSRRIESERLAREYERATLNHERSESMTRLSGQFAHHFNNSLQTIMSEADMMLISENLSPEIKDSSKRIISYCERAAVLTEKLLTYSGNHFSQWEKSDIHPIVSKAVLTWKKDNAVGHPVYIKDGKNLPSVEFSASLLQQALWCLLENALDFSDKPVCEIEIHLDRVSRKQLESFTIYSHSPLDEEEYVYLEVRDNGPGMKIDIIKKSIEPFFSTKSRDPGGTTGLGLSLVYGVMISHRGGVSISTSPNGGTSVGLFLPSTTNHLR